LQENGKTGGEDGGIEKETRMALNGKVLFLDGMKVSSRLDVIRHTSQKHKGAPPRNSQQHKYFSGVTIGLSCQNMIFLNEKM
jgi:hypothetical protein